MPAGTEGEQTVGFCHFEVEGVAYDTRARPFRFYVLKGVQDVGDGLSAADQSNVRDMLGACEMTALIDLRLTREMGGASKLEVWL